MQHNTQTGRATKAISLIEFVVAGIICFIVALVVGATLLAWVLGPLVIAGTTETVALKVLIAAGWSVAMGVLLFRRVVMAPKSTALFKVTLRVGALGFALSGNVLVGVAMLAAVGIADELSKWGAERKDIRLTFFGRSETA